MLGFGEARYEFLLRPCGAVDAGPSQDVPSQVADVRYLEQHALRQFALHAQAILVAARDHQPGIDPVQALSG